MEYWIGAGIGYLILWLIAPIRTARATGDLEEAKLTAFFWIPVVGWICFLTGLYIGHVEQAAEERQQEMKQTSDPDKATLLRGAQKED